MSGPAIVSCRICRPQLGTARALCAHFTWKHRPRVACPPLSARQDQLLAPGVPG